MAIIDLVKWSPDDDETVYAWRFPHTNLSTGTQLVVAESQEAVLFSKGEMIGKFGPGKKTLNTENLPILRGLFGIPFGGKKNNPFTAEVWFVNKVQPYNIDWETDNMSIHDVDYNTQLPLVARGRYGLRVKEAEKFLIKIVGTKSEFTQDDLTDQFFGEFSTKTKSTIVRFMNNHRVGYKAISGELDNLSSYLKGEMSAFWDNLGLDLTKFYITSVDIDTSTENGRRVAEAISKQSSMSITGHTWQQEQLFGVANNAVEGFGNGNGGLIGGLMAIQMMGGMGGVAGAGAGMMSPGYGGPSFGGNPQGGSYQGQEPQPTPSVRDVYCSNCSKKFPSTHRFCPHCGDEYNPCPQCGTDNEQNAKRCVSCGVPLTGGGDAGKCKCPHCNAPLQAKATFCGNCGKQVASADVCVRCGTPLQPGVKFCPKCGNKR
jgi:membrane protease subunit (stomatin/prohibitin family)